VRRKEEEEEEDEEEEEEEGEEGDSAQAPPPNLQPDHTSNDSANEGLRRLRLIQLLAMGT
jgi:hypothetical protein